MKWLPSIRPRLVHLVCAQGALASGLAQAVAGQALIRDLNQQPALRHSFLRAGISEAGRLFFPALLPDLGTELFVTDGTAAGSHLLLDIRTGTYGSEPEELSAAAGRVWFSADDGVAGRELWTSDGTPAGTRLLRDIAAGAASANPQRVASIGAGVVFAADDGVRGQELWVSDGTAAGTRLLLEIVPGPEGGQIAGVTTTGTRAVFAATDAVGDRDVWTTDGTVAGTVRLTVFRQRALSNPHQFTAAGAQVFFVAHDGTHGEELWVTDGTPAGTRLVRDIAPGISRSLIRGIAAAGSRVFFSAADARGAEPWVSDGTAAGTHLVADLRTAGFGSSNPGGFAPHGNLVFFTANDDFDQREVFATDGTTAGTVRIDVGPTSQSSFASGFASAARGMVFHAQTLATGVELFTSDGTPQGTGLITDLAAGPRTGAQGLVGVLNGEYYFAGDDGSVTGTELWAADGSIGGVRLVADLYATRPGDTEGSNPGSAVALADGTFLFAATSANGRELWRTDATAAGTVEVLDIEPGAGDGAPASLVVLGSVVIFGAFDSAHGREVWSSDGTAAGTARLMDIEPGAEGSNPTDLVRLGGAVLFFATTTSGIELWASDGTRAGTTRVRNLGAILARGLLPASAGDRAFFVAVTVAAGAELWITDGTAAGTHVVADVQPGAGSGISQPEGGLAGAALPFGGRLLFAADDGVRGNELWITDGTAAGTLLVGDLQPGPLGSNPRLGAVIAGIAYFSAEGANLGRELWRTDGTASGTFLVRDIVPGARGSNAQEITALDDEVVFSVFPAVGEHAIWRSDGTANGTFLLRSSTLPLHGYRRVGDSGVAVYVGEDAAHGRELWRTDGTVAGTHLVFDAKPGQGDGSAVVVATFGRQLLLAADDGVHGHEPWRLDVSATRAAWVGSYGTSCAGSGGRHPTLAASAQPQPGRSTFALLVGHARPLSPAAVLLAAAPVDLPWGPCRVLVDPVASILLAAATDAAGSARLALPIPPVRALRGSSLHAQAAIADAGSAPGLALSAGLVVVIGD